MATETTQPIEQQVIPGSPASPPPQSGAANPDDGYDPQWLGKASMRQKADVEAFFASQPVHEELKAVKNDLARRQKFGNLDKATVEQLLNANAEFEETKNLVISLGVATKEDIEDAQTTRELRLLLRGKMPKPASHIAPSAPGAQEESNPFFAQIDAWAKSRGFVPPPANGNPTGTDAFARGGGVIRAEQVTKDNIDQLYMDGKVPESAYRTFRKTGQLPT